MIKAKLILLAIKVAMWIIALGVGIWYVSSSLGGAAITYTSMDGFMNAIGAGNDIAAASGCFMCGYIAELFGTLGRATEMFWDAILGGLWILMAIGFGIFIIFHTAKHIMDAAATTAALDDKEKSIEFESWFDKIWRQGARVMFVGALIGALGMGGTTALRTVARVTITPVLFVGTELSMAAAGVIDATQCNAMEQIFADSPSDDILNPVLAPFMCVMGTLNSVMLAGAAGGFALMNYAWLGMGGGVFTWVAGLALVIMFLVVGFNLFFRVLSIVFKLIFLIIFLPLLLAAAAFEQTWSAAGNLFKNAINKILLPSAIGIVGVTLEVIIMYATISYAADEYFPGPADGYSAILPPMLTGAPQNPDARTLSVMNVFSECERVSIVDGTVDADTFKECFVQRKAAVERKYPGAFDFMDNGWEFLMLMFGLFVLYFYVVEPRVKKLFSVPDGEMFDFGGWLKEMGKKAWKFPTEMFGKVSKAVGKK